MEKKIKSLLTVLIAVTISLAFSSCGNKEENAIKQQISLMNEYADEFEKDPKSSKLAKIDKELHEVGERIQSMKELSEPEAKKLLEEYGKEMGEAAARYMKAKMGSAMGDMGKMLDGLDVDSLGR